MNMYWLYDFNKWPESIPSYHLQENQHFLWGWIRDIGFDKHSSIAVSETYRFLRYTAKTPCYPLESPKK